MKSNKALLPFHCELFIERIHRQLSAIFRDVILVTNTPEEYFLFRDENDSEGEEDAFPAVETVNSGCLNRRTPCGD